MVSRATIHRRMCLVGQDTKSDRPTEAAALQVSMDYASTHAVLMNVPYRGYPTNWRGSTNGIAGFLPHVDCVITQSHAWHQGPGARPHEGRTQGVRPCATASSPSVLAAARKPPHIHHSLHVAYLKGDTATATGLAYPPIRPLTGGPTVR